MRVIQVLPHMAKGDAISNDTWAIDKILKDEGIDTAIFTDRITKLPREGLNFTHDLLSEEADIVLYHCSTESSLTEKVLQMKGIKVMIYHNVTPPHFFKKYKSMKHYVTTCQNGIDQVKKFAPLYDYCICDSHFNKNDLISYGCDPAKLRVLPIVIPYDEYVMEKDRETFETYNDGKTNILFIGRIVPNKKQEDIITSFYYYNRFFNPNSRLILTGFRTDYARELEDYVEKYNIPNVVFTGLISFKKMLTFYSMADIFLCLSEHEGFCVPIVEAMYFKRPIIAYDSTAVGETLGKGGLLLDTKDPRVVAGAIDRVVKDDELRKALTDAQENELKRFSYDSVKELFLNILHELN